MRCPNVASTTTVATSYPYSARSARTASSSCASFGAARPSVAMFEPSTTTCFLFISFTSQANRDAFVGDHSPCAHTTYSCNVHDEPTSDVVDLLQHLIRNACVNDGTAASGHESRNVDVLAQYLGTSGFDVETYEAIPGRSNLVARIEVTDPTAPSLLLMRRTDV